VDKLIFFRGCDQISRGCDQISRGHGICRSYPQEKMAWLRAFFKCLRLYYIEYYIDIYI